MSRNRIAEAFIELKARGERQVNAAIGRVKDQLGGLRRNADAAFGRMGEGLDKATEGARKLQGAIGGVLGIVAAIGAIFFKIGNTIEKLGSNLAWTVSTQEKGVIRAKEFVATLEDSGVSDYAEQLARIRQEIERLNSLQANNSILVADQRLVEGGIEGIKAYTAALRELAQTRANRAEAERNREIRAQNEVIAAQIRSAEASAEAALLREKAQTATTDRARDELLINAENIDLQEQLIAIGKQRAEAEASGNTSALESLTRLRRFTVELSDERIRAIKREREEALKAVEEEKQARLQAAREVADANAQALRDLANAQRDAIASITGAQSQAFGQLADLVRQISAQVDLIRRNTRP